MTGTAVDDRALRDGLDQVVAALPNATASIRALEDLVRGGTDAELVRINPVRFAERTGCPVAEVVDVFLHARKAGLVTMEWQYVCPGCGDVVERLASLTSASSHYFCRICGEDRHADLSDYVAVTFTVSPAVRRSRFHDPWSLGAEEYFLDYRVAQDGVLEDGTALRDHIRHVGVAFAILEPGERRTFAFTAEPRFVWMTNGPALMVAEDRTDERRSFEFEYTGTRSQGSVERVSAGPVELGFTNATDERYALMIVNLSDHFEVAMRSFLSGAELLSNQTFLDLFSSETIVAGEGLAVRSLTYLFTDLKGSTSLYERIGDMKAFDLVRMHFGYLRECIARNSGALVKTIGDAVMASFVDPLHALRAAIDMRDTIARFNAEAGDHLIGLKIGLHAGASLAVTLNGRLDYFGQNVNIAARVQGVSDAGEIVLTDDVMSVPGAAELVAGSEIETSEVELRGVAGSVRVHRVRRGSPQATVPRLP